MTSESIGEDRVEDAQSLPTCGRAIAFGMMLGALLCHGCAPVATGRPGLLRVHPGNPRYFTDGSGKAVYLAGSHVWNNFQDWGLSDPPEPLDYGAYLDFLKQNNHNLMRGWVWEQSKSFPGYSGDLYISPLPFERTGPGDALDGKPKFDLTRLNQAYFDRVRSRCTSAADHGVYIGVMLFQGWSMERKGRGEAGNPWVNHPFNAANNINGINADPDGDNQGLEVHSLKVPAITAIQENYVRRLVDTLNDLDNILWEIGNECSLGSIEWQYHMIDFIKRYEAGKPKQHLVWMNGPDSALFKSAADCISPHNRGRGPDYKNSPAATTGEKVVILDTDHIWGLGGNRAWAWKCLMRGYHPLFMDARYYDSVVWPRGGVDGNAPQWMEVCKAIGHTRIYAGKVDLAATSPRDPLCSTKYCLANPGVEYLVYQPDSGPFTIDLVAGAYCWEWFDAAAGVVAGTGTLSAADGRRPFTPPVNGDGVLWLRRLTEPARDGST